MKDMEGWVKLYRKSFRSVVWRNPNTWMVWCWCLMRANHEPNTVRFHDGEIKLRPGQFISGRCSGAEECNMKQSTFQDQIKFLKKCHNLDTKSDRHKTIFTLIKWADYQDVKADPDSKKDKNRTTE